jgi:hypothetical protein
MGTLAAMALDLIAELEALLEAFERGGIEYALCGGLAVAVHGHPRATMDIDVLVRAEQLTSAIQVARGVGFDLPARKMMFGLRAGKPREMAMKQLAGRPQDLADIALLEGTDEDDQA